MRLKLALFVLFLTTLFPGLAFSLQTVHGKKIKPISPVPVTHQKIASNIAQYLQQQSQSTTRKKASASRTQGQSSTRITKKALHEKNRTVSFIRGKLSSGPIGGSLRDVVDQGWDQLRQIKPLAIDNEDGNFLFQKLKEDRLRKTHAWYQQARDGIPLWGKQVVFHMDEKNQVYQLQGDYLAKTSVNSLEPGILLEQALEYAGVAVDEKNAKLNSAELNYFDDDGEELRLAYKFELIHGLDKRWIVFIDAWNGSVLHKIYNIHSAGNVVAASGKNFSGETVNFNSWFENGTYYLIDPTTPVDEGSYAPLSRGPNPSGDTFIYDAKESDGSIVDFVSNSSANNGWDRIAVSALQNTHRVYNYFLDTFSRRSIDGNDKNLFAAVHFEKSYNNAFWNGSFMVYGNGDGRIFTPLANCLDVAAHEMTHGVIENTANLIYQNQSGALNESFADVFAIFMDRDDWTIGEDCTVIAPGYLRSFSNPESGLNKQPRKMSDYVNLPNTIDGDNGGVHINSGIPNHAAYLFVNRLIDLGFTKNEAYARAEQIYYRALDVYLHASSRFVDARRALISAAEDLYGDAEIRALNDVWDEVEVFDFGEEPVAQTPSSVKEVAGNDIMVYLTPIGGSMDLYVHIYEDVTATTVENNNYFGPINSQGFGIPVSVAETRPAAITDELGTLYFFVSQQLNLYSSEFNGMQFVARQLTDDNNIWSIAISPDGRYFAYTTAFQEAVINIVDLENGTEESYSIEPTSYQESGSSSTNTLLYADSLNFDFSSNKIVFDALNCISTPGDSCSTGGGYQYWSIGILDVASRRVTNPMPDQSPVIDLGYPTFATNNNYIIAMDHSVYDDSGTTPSFHSKVVSFNYETQEMHTLVDLGVASTQFFGVPSFWGNDSYMTTLRSSGGSALAQKIELTGNWERKGSSAVSLSSQPINYPIMHRAAYRKLTSLLTLSTDVLNFGNLDIGVRKTLALRLLNKGDFDVELVNISIEDAEFTHDAVNSRIPVNGSKTIKINFVGNSIADYNSVIHIQTDGSGSAYSIPLFAKVVSSSSGLDDTSDQENLLTLSTDVLNFGNLGVGVQKTLELGLSNKGDFDVELVNISIEDVEFTHDAVNSRIPVNGSKTIKINFVGNSIADYNSVIHIQTDGRVSAYSIPLFAKVVSSSSGLDDTSDQELTKDQSFGCSAGRGGTVDWMLVLLLMLAVTGLIRDKLNKQ